MSWDWKCGLLCPLFNFDNLSGTGPTTGAPSSSGVTSSCGVFCAAVKRVTPNAAVNPEDSIVRVAGAVHGLGTETLDGIAGVYPVIKAFDVSGQYIGHSNGAESQEKASDEFIDIVVHHEELRPSTQATYLQIMPEEPICLSYVSQNTSEDKPAIWTGEVGRSCGKEWYYSSGDHSPACTWVDAAIQLQLIVS